jgi:hypothetical protein
MRPDPVTIKLGEKEFKLRPLTLNQVRKIEALVLEDIEKRSKPDQHSRGRLDWSTEVILLALNRDYPNESADSLEGTAEEMGEAVRSIMLIGGFMKEKDADGAPQGEPLPAQPTGTPSTEA